MGGVTHFGEDVKVYFVDIPLFRYEDVTLGACYVDIRLVLWRIPSGNRSKTQGGMM